MAVYTVTNLNDSGAGSLRQAILDANAAAGADNIVFDNSLLGSGPLVLTTGELTITDDLTIDGDIDGDNKADVTVSGNNVTRVFNITGGTSVIDALTISGGTNSGGGSYNYGGGIRVYSPFALPGSTNVLLTNSNVENNAGTAIYNFFSVLTITNSTFTGNSGGFGGAVRDRAPSTNLSITNSTFVGNTALFDGGAIYMQGPNGNASLANVTVSGNQAQNGGGISSSGVLSIQNSTITGNFASNRGGGVNVNPLGNVDLSNTIVAGNETNGFTGDNLYVRFGGTATYSGVNVFSEAGLGDAQDIIETTLTNIFATVGADPNTGVTSGVLANNGGDVQTVAIAQGGAAHNNGDDAALPADSQDLDQDTNTAEDIPFDARGAGFERNKSGQSDVGALELQNLVVTTLDDETAATTDLATELADGNGLSLREAIAIANANASQDTITFNSALAGGTLVLVNGNLAISEDVTIDGDTNGDHKADITISGDADSSGTANAGDSRIFNITGGTTDATLQSLTLTGGYSQFGGSGGAVRAGFANSVTIENSTLHDNVSSSQGGGLYAYSTTVVAINSTFYGNTAVAGSSGGIYAINSDATLTNVTVHDNTAIGSGAGGVGWFVTSGTNNLIISNSTITDNRGNEGGVGISPGGGLLTQGAGNATLNNTVISGNENGPAGSATNDDVFNTIGATNLAVGFSFMGTAISGTYTDNGGNTNGGGDPVLGELLDNGGTVLTQSPLDGSPLIGTGSNLLIPADTQDIDNDGNTAEDLPLDARGGLRLVGGTVDIGAVEQIVDETIRGTATGNNIIGGLGTDNLGGLGGPDTLDGGAGSDTADYSTASSGVTVDLEAGTGVGGDAQVDTLISIENATGSGQSDTLVGSGITFQDAATGDMAVNTLDGGDGDDLLRGGAGADVLIGGAGTGDTADYSTSYGAVNVSLTTETGRWNHAEGDTLNGIENLTGSNLSDTLIGDGMANILTGLTGDDFLSGEGGNDTLIGGGGSDTLLGGTGIDTADYSASVLGVTVDLITRTGVGGDAQGDTIISVENLIGSNGDDVLIGTGVTFFESQNGDMAVNTLNGGGGDDTLRGGAGSDMLIGGAGTGDTADYSTSYGAVNVSLTTETGRWNHAEGDTLNGIENLDGSNFNDTLIGDDLANVLRGLNGNDALTGNGAGDTFVFEDNFGSDTITDFDIADATEVINLANVTEITDFNDLMNNHLTSNLAGDAVIFDGTNTITLTNVLEGNLTMNEFDFT